MPHDQEAVEQTKRDCRDDEQIHRRDAVGVITEKCFPTLGRRPSTRGHILSYAGLADIDAELEKLAVDTRRSGLAMLILRMSFRISSGTVGRPPPGRDFQRQYDLNPARCQRTMVSGFTIASASQMFGNNR